MDNDRTVEATPPENNPMGYENQKKVQEGRYILLR